MNNEQIETQAVPTEIEKILSNLDKVAIEFTESLQDKILWEEIDGVKFPFVPSEVVTIDDGTMVGKTRPIPPAYITNLQQWKVSGNEHTFKAAMLSAKKEVLLYFVRELTLRVKGYEAPIAVSTALPPDHVFFDGQRIIINEAQATHRYMDADGDRGMVIFNADRTQCVLVKFPITSPPLVLTVAHKMPHEQIFDFTAADWKALQEQYPVKTIAEPLKLPVGITAEEAEELTISWNKHHWDMKDQFLKTHKDAPVGLLTNAWNCFDLWMTRHLSYWQKLPILFNTEIDEVSGKPLRAITIEDNTMKAVRKDANSFGETLDILKFGSGRALDHNMAWALTSASSIGGMRENQLDWVFDANFEDLLPKIVNLDVTFREVNPSPQKPIIKPMIDGKLMTRLQKLGLVRYIELPHANPTLPPAILFYLSMPNGEAVALTDVKRENNRDVGLTYAFLLPPVWDNVNLVDKHGSIVVKATKQFVHPFEHMKKVMATFDSRILFLQYDEDDSRRYGGFFPSSWDDFKNPRRSVKVSLLQKAIQEYCGVYGDPCPAHKIKGTVVPTKHSLWVASNTVVVDYGRDLDEQIMFSIMKQVQKQTPINAVGSKSTNRRVRTYAIGDDQGFATWSYDICHPARPGKSRAQLQRVIGEAKYRIAVVKIGSPVHTGTSNQVLICPSGIPKQHTEDAFLNQVFNTYAGYENHLKGLGIEDPDELPATRNEFFTWTGEKRLCWTIGPRSAIKIGKLIDRHGNKFLPRQYPQAFELGEYDATVELTPTGKKKVRGGRLVTNLTKDEDQSIDLIIPVKEFVDKYNHHQLMKGAVERQVIINGKEVTAMVIEKTLYRTGSASENIPPRTRKSGYRGMDSYPIRYALSQIRELPETKINTGFADALIGACKQLMGTDGSTETLSTDVKKFLSGG